MTRCDDSCGNGSGGASQPSNRPPSREHSNVEAGSDEENVKVALVLLVGLAGPVKIVVSGSCPSLTQVHSSGVRSRIPCELFARTSRMCSPSARPVISCGVLH